MKPRYTDAFWGEHPFDGDMIFIKNKNNKNKNKWCGDVPTVAPKPQASMYPGIYSYVRGYNLTQENACCLRLQPHLYPSMVGTGLGRGDELRHSRRE